MTNNVSIRCYQVYFIFDPSLVVVVVVEFRLEKSEQVV
jgi:hypothetical protein